MRRLLFLLLAVAAVAAAAVLLRARRRRDDEPRPAATAPVETPGPSVPAPALSRSDMERAERAEWAGRMEPDLFPPGGQGDTLVAREESAAAAEAGAIGGWAPHDTDDPAMDPVYEAGGGEQDGFEQAEADLIDNASHGDGHGKPLRDMLAPEAESDRSSADYGEADSARSTGVVEGDDHSPRG